ncbi:MAG: endonuclease/exonuclease/phosphatase family protein [Candidatus Obscuribacterales bacterium]|nr:endonuclease/exonuclease/phosphatase family protein [Candidatus Obscuribacterales bacterium]
MSTTKRPWKFWLSQLSTVWMPLALVAAAFTFIGYFGNAGLFFDLAGIFRAQYLLILVVAVIIFAFAKKKLLLCISAAALIANSATLFPLYISASRSCEGSNIRILQMNVNSQNHQFSRAFELIAKLAPDVISIEEVDPDWQKALEANLTSYPFRCIKARPDNFGIALFSKLPFDDIRIIYLGEAGVPSITALVKSQNQYLRLLTTHVLPPVDTAYFNFRNEQFDKIAEFLAAEKEPVVLAGDLNCPPWSYYFEKLCQSGNLTDSSKGFGIQPTWPTNTPLLLIPIDHLLSRGVTIKTRFVTSPIGSDHYPLCVDLILPENKQ